MIYGKNKRFTQRQYSEYKLKGVFAKCILWHLEAAVRPRRFLERK